MITNCFIKFYCNIVKLCLKSSPSVWNFILYDYWGFYIENNVNISFLLILYINIILKESWYNKDKLYFSDKNQNKWGYQRLTCLISCFKNCIPQTKGHLVVLITGCNEIEFSCLQTKCNYLQFRIFTNCSTWHNKV